MSGINHIIQTFEGLGEDDRETTMKALATMMRVESQPQPAKRRVNGFMGFRAYYSSLFARLTQKERSPIITMLWKHDPFHKEWDFLCAVYSAIREDLADQKIPLQIWIQFAIRPLGVIVRESYLAALGWQLVQLEDGTHTLERTVNGVVQSHLQPMNGLGLFMSCLNDGLPVPSPLPIIAKLSDLANDVICINMQAAGGSGLTQSTNSMDGFRQLARTNPQLAMAAIFQVPEGHPMIAQGIDLHHVPNELPAPETFVNPRDFILPQQDVELDEMLEKIFQSEAAAMQAAANRPMGMDPNYFTIDPLPEQSEPGFN
ncbi:Synaptic functional regulator fmr1 [Madurella fahalii]|uniref:Synaptic functional regulator fmr1 n=1 Tax=Madurella fahalii TaxID=1157608 RepID=A0ABQ0G2M2_9PEZI